ncbi:hypothetical protein Cgig2_023067 [Carnegiea gigantea]|uniref:Bidirectional sugar transporter SWEET n=1 Tax=Carnegiea gigantea TaxID=171969 RepID=A0A9Q1GY45_9CARY|nr:hypothetical protein Cgig2_023067 [Carnegiea gigantea]
MALTSINFHELAFVFGILGNIVSFGVYLAPVPTFWRIFKKKSTEGFQSIPYAVALFSAMLLLYYAFLKEDNATMIITINSIGCAIEGFYLIMYLIYARTNARVYTFKLLGLFNVAFYCLIVLVTMGFVHGCDHHNFFSKGGNREKVVGWICAVFSVSVFAAPLSVMRTVIRTKSVEFMPFWLSFFLTLCAVMWFFYGFLIHDFYIALPNIMGFAFGIAQMILYILYKDLPKKQKQGGMDMKQLQELAADIKLGNIERIGHNGAVFEHARPEVVEVIVDTPQLLNNEDKNENPTTADKEPNGVKAEQKHEKIMVIAALPRGEISCV